MEKRRGILAGMASPGSLWERTEYPKLAGSDLSRLRGDAQKIGGYFATVIERENGKTTSASSESAKASKRTST
jgi:hypothetical protein